MIQIDFRQKITLENKNLCGDMKLTTPFPINVFDLNLIFFKIKFVNIGQNNITALFHRG